MLNRRILRAKAMQALYSVRLCKEANYDVALDKVAQKFLPDLMGKEKPNIEQLNKEKEIAVQLFAEKYQGKEAISDKDGVITPKIRQAVIEGISYYHSQNKKDNDSIGENILREADKLYNHYLSILQLVVELSDFADTEAKERQKRQLIPTPIFENEQKFFTNKTITKLRNHRGFAKEVLDQKLYWDKEIIREWYKLLQKEETYTTYQQLASATEFQDAEFAIFVLRDFILKNDIINSYFDEHYYNWQEDKVTVRSMALKCLKGIHEQGDAAELIQLSPNWDEDRDFCRQLYYTTLKNQEDLAQLVGKKAENWDISRITPVDLILMQMALCEMMHFPSIPVKVTINEYLEVAKEYGTPKSKDFLNGLLDVLSVELEKEGKIKKSGRGLLDNK